MEKLLWMLYESPMSKVTTYIEIYLTKCKKYTWINRLIDTQDFLFIYNFIDLIIKYKHTHTGISVSKITWVTLISQDVQYDLIFMKTVSKNTH